MSNGLAGFFGDEGFDPYSIEPQKDFEPISPGKYPVLIEAAECKQTKAGNGFYLKLTLSVLDGQHKGRKVWDNINIENPSAQCVEIGLKTLAALGQAIGIPKLKDESQLLNQVAIAHVKVKDGQNSVRTYSSVQATASAALVVPDAPQPAPVPVAPAAAPVYSIAPLTPAASPIAPVAPAPVVPVASPPANQTAPATAPSPAAAPADAASRVPPWQR